MVSSARAKLKHCAKFAKSMDFFIAIGKFLFEDLFRMNLYIVQNFIC